MSRFTRIVKAMNNYSNKNNDGGPKKGGTKEMKESCLPRGTDVWKVCGWLFGWWLCRTQVRGTLGISMLFSTNDTSVKVNTHFNFICCEG